MTDIARVFVTGSTGCVGQYVLDALAADAGWEIHALARPGSARPSGETAPGGGSVIWHEGGLESIQDHAGTIRSCRALVHLATAWDDSQRAFEINVDRTLDLIGLCDAAVCRRIVVCSTASILGRDNQLLDVARDHGTAYVRSKHLLQRRLEASVQRDRIVSVFPTLVFGGDATHRWSHVAREWQGARRYLGLARFFRATGGFHFIHARDVAAMVAALVAPAVGAVVQRFPAPHGVEGSPARPSELVLGQPAVTFDAALSAICEAHGWRYRGWWGLTPRRVMLACRLLRVRLSPWDRYSIEHPFFTHRVTRPEDLRLTSAYPTLASVLRDVVDACQEP